MKKNEYHVLGVMSGTSLDGIDISEIVFRKESSWNYEILEAETIPYSEVWQKKLAEAVFYSSTELEELNQTYTNLLAEVLAEFISRHQIENLDAVCSHGHTIKHEPQNGYTLQIGNLPSLAKRIGQKLVCDFRVQDVKLGGQGAPLVPVGDELLFADYEYCLNLGGFANVSTNRNGQRVAYDICAVNTVMNHLAERIGKPYDKDGEVAASGNLDEELLTKLDALDFYKQSPPKSLGIEWVNQYIFPLLKDYKKVPDAMHTYAVHAARQIAAAFDNNPASTVLITGGGAFNTFFIDCIRNNCANRIVIPAPEVVNYKEALIFGFLGILKLREEVNVLSSVTGASRDHSSGEVYT